MLFCNALKGNLDISKKIRVLHYGTFTKLWATMPTVISAVSLVRLVTVTDLSH